MMLDLDVKKPSFIVIGAMKSATSTLYEQLRRQSAFFMPELKEPNYFSDDDVFANGAEWYESLFSGASNKSIIGEASTHYTKLPDFPEAASRMSNLLPSVKLIYIMRHPIDRLVSHHIHGWTQGDYSSDIDSEVSRHSELIDYGRYHYQLEPYIRLYGREAILPVFFERLTTNSNVELERICRFLGYDGPIDWYTESAEANVSKDRVRKFPLYRVLVDNDVSTWLRRRLVPQSLRARIKSKFQMNHRPSLHNSTLLQLHKVFDRDLEKLGKLLGLDLDCESYNRIISDHKVKIEWT